MYVVIYTTIMLLRVVHINFDATLSKIMFGNGELPFALKSQYIPSKLCNCKTAITSQIHTQTYLKTKHIHKYIGVVDILHRVQHFTPILIVHTSVV